MRSGFKDHFSGLAQRYADARPNYPEQLFRCLAALTASRSTAWDCGTGNGQAALGLVPHFDNVVATDPSVEQISHARPHQRINYCVSIAEKPAFGDCSFDLVTVAQALHWFDVERFYGEVRRVTKENGVLAAWCYQLLRIHPEIDEHIDTYYHDIVGVYWPPERKHVDRGYRSLPFPFEELCMPSFSIEKFWDLQQVEAYLRSWSATRRFMQEQGSDPVDPVMHRIARVWGDTGTKRLATWPIQARVGRVIV